MKWIFIYPSLWIYRKLSGLYIRHTKVNYYLHFLLLVCGDIQSCPGPQSVGCKGCSKSVRINQYKIACSDCRANYHVECIGPEFNITQRCLSCLSSKTTKLLKRIINGYQNLLISWLIGDWRCFTKYSWFRFT